MRKGGMLYLQPAGVGWCRDFSEAASAGEPDYCAGSLDETLLPSEARDDQGGGDLRAIKLLYGKYAGELLREIQGDVAFCFVDEDAAKVVLGASAYSSRTLYYSFAGGRLKVAESLRAFASDSAPTIDHEALASLLAFGLILPPLTFIDGVRQLRHGEVREFDIDVGEALASTPPCESATPPSDDRDRAENEAKGAEPRRSRDRQASNARRPAELDALGQFAESVFEPLTLRMSGMLNALYRCADDETFEAQLRRCLLEYDIDDVVRGDGSLPADVLIQQQFTKSSGLAERTEGLRRQLKEEHAAWVRQGGRSDVSAAELPGWFRAEVLLVEVLRKLRRLGGSHLLPDAGAFAAGVAKASGASSYAGDGEEAVVEPLSMDDTPMVNVYDAFRRLFYYGSPSTTKKIFDLSRKRWQGVLAHEDRRSRLRVQDSIFVALTVDMLSRRAGLRL